MSKFKKERSTAPTSRKSQNLDESFAYRTVILSTVLAGVFLVISILFNAELITFFMNRDLIWSIIDITLKVFAILLFFLFMIVSVGNYKDLIGKPLTIKELLLIFVISLLQSFKNSVVFAFTFIGLITFSIYIYLVQES